MPETEPTDEEIKKNEEENKKEEEKKEEETNNNNEKGENKAPEEEKSPEPVIENSLLNLKEQQTYLKKLGLYTKKIDGIRGAGHKKAVKQFNTIFLNKESEVYYDDTDKLLREVYASYNNSPYMTDSDWKYFKNFKSGEVYCTCKKKY